KRKQFANHLEAHSGCGSILALEGEHALRAINSESAWYRRIFQGDRVEDVNHAPCVNMLALASPDATRHQRFKASAAAKLLHLVNISGEPLAPHKDAGFRVDEKAIAKLE